MSGGKRSGQESVHFELLSADLDEVRSWDGSEDLTGRHIAKVVYVCGITSAGCRRFDHSYDHFKVYKAATGADAEPFSSWYSAHLLKTFEPTVEVAVLRGKLERAIQKLEDDKPVVVTLAEKFELLKKFEELVAAELALWRAGKIRKPSTKGEYLCRRGCGCSSKSPLGRASHEKVCEYVRNEAEDDLIEPKSRSDWIQLAKKHQLVTSLVPGKVAGRFETEGWAASAYVAAKARRIELEAEQKKAGTAEAEADAAQSAAWDAYKVIAKTFKNHELNACRDLNPKQLEARFRPRAKALADHFSAISVRGGRALVESGRHLVSLAAAEKAKRASRLNPEFRAAGYVPHNNDERTQDHRRAEGMYDGADLFAAVTGIGQQ